MKPAERIREVKEYYFSKKLKEIAQMNAEGMNVLNLGIGNPDQAPSAQTIETLISAAERSDTHGYQSYIGIPKLRTAFSDWYSKWFGVELNPDTEILPLIGSKEGIMHISMAFVNPGDQVLIPNPAYPAYAAVSKLVGAEAITYNLEETLSWQPDLDALEQKDLSKVKIMWVNYPNMPTGTPADMEFFRKLIAFGKKHNILICNDNPYSFILNENPKSILAMEGAKDVAIELNSLSKSHNMAGWRIGMVAGSAEHIQYILRVKSNMDSGTFRAMQEAAAVALQNGADWYENINKSYKERRTVVEEILDLVDAEYSTEQVGMFMWAKIGDRYKDAAELSDKILYEAKVFLTPGFIFGSAGERFIRISLCSSMEMLQEAKERIRKVIQQ